MYRAYIRMYEQSRKRYAKLTKKHLPINKMLECKYIWYVWFHSIQKNLYMDAYRIHYHLVPIYVRMLGLNQNWQDHTLMTNTQYVDRKKNYCYKKQETVWYGTVTKLCNVISAVISCINQRVRNGQLSIRVCVDTYVATQR